MVTSYARSGTGVCVGVGPGKFSALLVAEVGGTTVVVTFDDSTDGTGNVLGVISCPANDSRGISPPDGVAFSTGVYATVTGAGTASITVYA